MEWINTDNIRKETWRRLLEFANDDFAINQIEKKFGPSNKSNRANYEKQARQVRLCLLQAKEYLDSSESTSIFTSPNLLYYASVSLCSAAMLINGSGEKSLDFLRKKGQSRSHGLSFSLDNQKNAAHSINLLDSAYLKVERNGFFKEWHETLPEQEDAYGLHRKYEDENHFVTGLTIVGKKDLYKFNQLVGEKASLIDLLKKIPDQVSDLRRLGVEVSASRVDELLTITDDMEHREWKIHNAGSETDLDNILSKFEIDDKNNDADFEITKNLRKDAAIVQISYRPSNLIKISWPDIRLTTNGTPYCFADSSSVMEIVDCFGILYILGMICRYYPDIWIETIDNHSISSKIIENTIETMKTKMPILALELLSKRKTIISSQRAPWHNS